MNTWRFLLDNKGLGAASIYDLYSDGERLTGGEREWAYLFNVAVEHGSFALNEGPCLTYANQCQYGGEKADNPSPSEHRSVKWVGWRWEVGRAIVGWCLVALAFVGALVGVWSVVFWDRLGRWRWFVSSLGWIALIGGLVQGLSLLTTF
jgi:hypothetical protein